jgi:GDP-4-dehydro-6-deoxy-D-mannose reductase
VSGPILVTGASGFAGSHLLEHLAGGEQVVAWSRRAPAPSAARLARWQQVELLDKARVASLLADLRPSVVFHLGGQAQVAESWGDTAAPLSANVLATHYLLEGLRSSGRRTRVLVTGSAHVYAASPSPIAEDHPLAPSSPYALSKLAQEQLALRAIVEDGLDVLVTRSFNHTGPRQSPSFVAPSIARQIALAERGAGPPVIKVGHLDTRRDLLDVRDTVEAYAALVRFGRTGAVYNVASGLARPVAEILDALLQRARVPIVVESDPARMRPSDIPVLAGDATRLREATGWAPRIPFEQTMDDLLDFWRGAVGDG